MSDDAPAPIASLTAEDLAKLAAGGHVAVDGRGVVPVSEVGVNPGQEAVTEAPYQITR